MKVTNLFTEKDREVFDRIDRDCLSMHVPPPPKMFLKLEVVGPDGETIDRYEDRTHSWVRNASNGMCRAFVSPAVSGDYGPGSITQVNSSGGTLSAGYTPVGAGVGVIDRSILVGTSAAAESFDMYQYHPTMIDNGSAAGQLAYQAAVFGTGNYDSLTKKWTNTLSRVLNNNSGGDITVREVVLAVYGNTMIARDVLATPKTIPNAGQLTVTYTIEMTFPA